MAGLPLPMRANSAGQRIFLVCPNKVAHQQTIQFSWTVEACPYHSLSFTNDTREPTTTSASCDHNPMSGQDLSFLHKTLCPSCRQNPSFMPINEATSKLHGFCTFSHATISTDLLYLAHLSQFSQKTTQLRK
jgi:hypothetical protein